MTPYLLFVLVVIGFTATYLWRFLGVLLADHLSPEMPIVYWVELVGYGLIATIMARIALMPDGPLEDTPLILRLSAIALSIVLARFTRIALLPAILIGAVFFGVCLYVLA